MTPGHASALVTFSSPIAQQVLWVQSITQRGTQLPEVTVNVGEWHSEKVTFEPSGERNVM